MAKKTVTTKKPPKKRNLFTDKKKDNPPETPETTDVRTDEKPTASKPIGKSRKKDSKEETLRKDAEYQKKKRDEKREEKEVKGDQESKELEMAIEVFCCMPFDYLGERDEKWRLKPEEREAFTGSAKAMMDKYASTLSGYAIETSFLLCASSILIPRLMFNDRKDQQDVSGPGEKRDGKNPPGQTDDRVPS
jgi:hypothetical protein